MIIGFLKENDEHENRTMLLPEHVSKLSSLGFKILIENEYGVPLFANFFPLSIIICNLGDSLNILKALNK